MGLPEVRTQAMMGADSLVRQATSSVMTVDLPLDSQFQ